MIVQQKVYSDVSLLGLNPDDVAMYNHLAHHLVHQAFIFSSREDQRWPHLVEGIFKDLRIPGDWPTAAKSLAFMDASVSAFRCEASLMKKPEPHGPESPDTYMVLTIKFYRKRASKKPGAPSESLEWVMIINSDAVITQNNMYKYWGGSVKEIN